ncbi:MAG TPA: aminotransferase class I/II-fold pyridoxal phosphate-dependent enzyme [Oligoflexia bacterium]|nr:aminotransferase class I/II-fold pyridoxal phosphate-dependent enzyme [Oligoflexia bacterium]HMP49600.1 aminotransferase class I/II-fold pyridoxal phosphate-dependent enzyme [Oligoflexia bacterium]
MTNSSFTLSSINLDQKQIQNLREETLNRFNAFKSKSLSLDMTRGKPGPDQLALSNSLDGILSGNFISPSKTDARNYGGLDGLSELKSLFAPVLEVKPEDMLIGGNSSLTLMYQYMDHAYHHGTRGKASAWINIEGGPSFLCPVPGYDRHFAICEFLGIRMINVPLNEDGIDLKTIEDLLKRDKTICGIWCVPKYSNPSGITYSKENINELVSLVKLARPEFRVMWDNAYAIHDLEENGKSLPPVLSLSEQQGTSDKFVLFGSTSKISFAGAGVAFSAMNNENLKSFQHYLSFQTIGPDKVNQLRHLHFFKTFDGLISHMKGHRELLKPKFDTVLNGLDAGLNNILPNHESSNIKDNSLSESIFAKWTKPKGGYFISLDTLPGVASETIRLASELGVKITPAGSTYPYGKDPEDKNIRLAPSFPSIDDLKIATEAFTTALILATVNKLS